MRDAVGTAYGETVVGVSFFFEAFVFPFLPVQDDPPKSALVFPNPGPSSHRGTSSGNGSDSDATCVTCRPPRWSLTPNPSPPSAAMLEEKLMPRGVVVPTGWRNDGGEDEPTRRVGCRVFASLATTCVCAPSW